MNIALMIGYVFILILLFITAKEMVDSAKNVSTLKKNTTPWLDSHSRIQLKLSEGIAMSPSTEKYLQLVCDWRGEKLLEFYFFPGGKFETDDEKEKTFKQLCSTANTNQFWFEFIEYEYLGTNTEEDPPQEGIYLEGIFNNAWHRYWWFAPDGFQVLIKSVFHLGDDYALRKKEVQDTLLESLSFPNPNLLRS